MSSATATVITGGFTEASLESFLRSRDEPSWLVEAPAGSVPAIRVTAPAGGE